MERHKYFVGEEIAKLSAVNGMATHKRTLEIDGQEWAGCYCMDKQTLYAKHCAGERTWALGRAAKVPPPPYTQCGEAQNQVKQRDGSCTRALLFAQRRYPE